MERLGIMELWRGKRRKITNRGLETIANTILNYDSLGRIFDSWEVFGMRLEGIGTTESGWKFDCYYDTNHPDKNPNISALVAVKESKGIDILCVVSKSQYLCFASGFHTVEGRACPEVGMGFANLLYIDKGVNKNNLILHEIGHALGLEDYPDCRGCTSILHPEIEKGCKYLGYIMCRADNSRGLHEGDIKKLAKLLAV